MCFACLLGLSAITATQPQSEVLRLVVEATPTSVRLGDVLFLRISVQNRGTWPARLAGGRSLEHLSAGVELHDEAEDTVFRFSLDGYPLIANAENAPLRPGETPLLRLLMLPLPSLDCVYYRFWAPDLWRAGKYQLRVWCEGVSPSATEIFIEPRPREEMAKLLACYAEGRKAPPVRDWPRSRPSLHTFSYYGFPFQTAQSDNLAALEEVLSPGSLRDIVRATRLTQAVYDAKGVAAKREAAARLFQWLDRRAEIERHKLVMQLADWSWDLQTLGTYGYEFVDALIPRLPPDYRGQDYRQYYRRQYLL